MALSNTTHDGAILAIGERLRALRVDAGLSLREVALRSELSPSFVGMVERGECEIAITRLMRLADVYRVTVGDLIGALEPQSIAHRVSPHEGDKVEADDGRVLVNYLPFPGAPEQPFLLVIEPGGELAHLEHAAAEFFHCLEGQVTVTIDDASYEIAPGDTIYVPDGSPHAWQNDSSAPCRLFGVVGRIP